MLPQITEDEFLRLNRLLLERCGIRIPPEKKLFLQAKLGKVLHREGISSYSEYCDRILADKSGRELLQLLDLITAPDLHQFFSEPQQFAFLSQQILTELNKKGANSVYIWSVGCATGEEAYSIAIILDGSKVTEGWRKKILATDVSPYALDKAREGIYPAEELKLLSPSILAHYFEREGEDTYRIKGTLKEIIEFRKLSLLSPPPFHECFDVIFCRNVMIYYDRGVRKDLTSYFHGCLKPGGYLIIGPSETLAESEVRFQYVRSSIYRKASQ